MLSHFVAESWGWIAWAFWILFMALAALKPRKVAPVTARWTFGTGTRVRLRLAASTASSARAELGRLGFTSIVVYTDAADVEGWGDLGSGAGPWAEAVAGGGFVPRGLVLEAEAVPLFPAVSPSVRPTALRPVGELPTRPDVTSRTSARSWEFYEGVAAMAARHGWDPMGPLAIMYSESNLNPAAGGHPAVGLIQFDGTLPNVGYTGTPAEFQQLSDVEQLPYVERYYVQDRVPPGANGTAFYLANYEPGKLAHWDEPDYVLDRQDDDPHGFYRANGPVFDVDRKGTITVGDLTARLARVCTGPTWGEHLARLKWAVAAAAGPDGPASTGGSIVPGLVSAGLVVLAGLGTWAYVQGAPQWLRRLPSRFVGPARRARATG